MCTVGYFECNADMLTATENNFTVDCHLTPETG